MVKVKFTKHALFKFKDLSKLGVNISKKKILDILKKPENLEEDIDYPNIIVSGELDKTRVMRIVYRKEDDKIVVVTFYPAKKGRYY